MTAARVAFWLSAPILAYAWLGYPLAVAWLARHVRRERPRQAAWPRVSVIVAAFNEATSIAEKLRTTIEQRYPAGRLQVVVVSDGSTDGTDEVVRRCQDRRVRLVRQERRAGKSVALNRGVALATGDILVFTDANAMFAPDAIARLAAAFADPGVGLVSGHGLYAGSTTADARAVGNGYVHYEARIRAAEAALGFMAGVDGAIYAMRRELFRELDPAEVNDLLHPIQIELAGRACRFEPDAYTVEPPSDGGRQEFGRHVRIIAQGVHIVRQWLPRLVRARRWRATWMLVSHRVLRWTSAPLMVAALVANLALSATDGLYAVTLAGQAAFYGAALAGLVAERLGVGIGRLSVPYYFCVVCAAGVGGVIRYARSGAQAVWAPTSAATERAA
jgi:glycosyl transferase family 2